MRVNHPSNDSNGKSRIYLKVQKYQTDQGCKFDGNRFKIGNEPDLINWILGYFLHLIYREKLGYSIEHLNLVPEQEFWPVIERDRHELKTDKLVKRLKGNNR